MVVVGEYDDWWVPAVSRIGFDSADAQRITLDGAVRRPGVFEARGQMTLLHLLAEANELSDTGDYSGVMVFRSTPQGRMVARFDTNAIRAGQAADPQIYGGDTIKLPGSSSAKVCPWRASSGSFEANG